MNIGGRYNWKGQPERLIYLGLCEPRNGRWHQFAKVEAPSVVWCEVLDSDLRLIEETQDAAGAQEGPTCPSCGVLMVPPFFHFRHCATPTLGAPEVDECGTCRKALPDGCNTEFQGEPSCALTSDVKARYQCAACDWSGSDPIDGGDHLRQPACPKCMGDVLDSTAAGVGEDERG